MLCAPAFCAVLVLAGAPSGQALGGEPSPAVPPLPDPAAEQPAALPPAPPPDADRRLIIAADRIQSRGAGRDAEGRAVTRVLFSGGVEAVRGDLALKCRELEVESVAGEEGGGSRPRLARARGKVEITTPRRRAVAEEAGYDLAAEKLTVTGRERPVIHQDGHELAAESFVLSRAAGVFEARGKVSAVLQPRPAAEAEKGARPAAARKTRVDASGGAVYDDARRQLFLKDDVLVRQEGFELACDRLWVLFAPEGPKEAGKSGEAGAPAAGAGDPLGPLEVGSVRKVVAEGRVRLTAGRRLAVADLAAYDPLGKTVVLSGRDSAPVIRDEQGLLTAPQIVYYIEEERLESRGGPFRAVVGDGRLEAPAPEKPPGKPEN